jgi:hypothetical protein
MHTAPAAAAPPRRSGSTDVLIEGLIVGSRPTASVFALLAAINDNSGAAWARIDAGRLLADLKNLRKNQEEDLRGHHRVSKQREAIESESGEALNTKRAADTFDTFFDSAVDQAAAHWILALIFLRFLEDNRLFDRPVIAGAAKDWRWRSSASGSGFERGLKTATLSTC